MKNKCINKQKMNIKEHIARLKQFLNSDYLDGLISFWQDKSAKDMFEEDVKILLQAYEDLKRKKYD
ncbi:MAG: hypothetical protein ACTSPD_10110 [Promethearchaeota archaeon]